MATWWGNNGDNYYGGTPADDSIYGGYGNDELYGGAGNDLVVGTKQGLYEGGYNDNDNISGGPGTDRLWGGYGADWFYFSTMDSGDITVGGADTIYDFSDGNDFYEGDMILLPAQYTYGGNTWTPGEGQYSIWKLEIGQYNPNRNDAYVVTWNGLGDDGWHDVIVLGANPEGNIGFF